jgi:two-component system clock-associated histidine kinase SasA
LTEDIVTHSEDPDPTIIQTMPLLLDSANSLMRLVDSLLDLGSDSKLPLHLASVSVQDIVDSAFKALATSFQEANIKVTYDIPKTLPQVQVDPDIIRRVLINLLDNAMRYTPFDGEIMVTAAPYQDGNLILMRVADSGPGIPDEERERVFEKFRQVKANVPKRGSKGSGLGLAFCKRGIEAHGQRIWVAETSPLSGACFAFTMPKAAPPTS